MRLAAIAGMAVVAAVTVLAAQQTAGQQPSTPPTAPAPAQQPGQQPPQPPPVFRAEANLVRVDVTVVDRHGELMAALTADDFALEEDGVPQTVQSFQFVVASGRRTDNDGDSLAIRSPEHAAAEAARDDVRVFVVFWDDYHIDRFANAIRGRQTLTDFLASSFGPTDLVALMEPLTPMDALRFSRDRGELGLKIKKLEGRLGVYMPPRGVLEEAQLGHDVERLRSEVTLSALKSAAVHLGSLKEGRKSIIFVSQGLYGLGRDGMRDIEEMTQAANDNNVAIYTVDPKGLTGGVMDSLRTIADDTGGQAFVNSNAPANAMRQIVKDSSAFYLIGYVSSKNPVDGKYHKIGVRVKRPGAEVRARKGYWAPSLTEIEKEKAVVAAAEAVPADLTTAAAKLAPPRPERLLDVWVGAALGADAQTQVTVAWTSRARPASGDHNRIVAVSTKGSGSDRSFESPIDTGVVSFVTPPGNFRLNIAVRDAAGNIIDEELQPVTIPDLASAQLAISSPIVLRARSMAEVRALAGLAHPAPFAGRDFTRADRLFIRFALYGSAAKDAAVSAHLLTKAGAPLAELTAVPQATSGEYQIDLPLVSTARGEFIVAVEAVQGELHPRALVPFRVVVP
ncbi:MAG TPA: VWA domain-containing protein [Vicinamibacterales bacterium]